MAVSRRDKPPKPQPKEKPKVGQYEGSSSAPKPGDPAYDEWLRMANAEGVTVDEMYRKTLGTSVPEGQTAAASTTPTPPKVGMYKGQKYDPGGSAWNVPAALAWGGEVFAEANIKSNAKQLQQKMDTAYEGLKDARNPQEIQHWTNQIQDIRDEYSVLMNHVESGASGWHASQRMFATGQPIREYGNIAENVESGFNVNLAYQLREPTGNRVADRIGVSAQPSVDQTGFQTGLEYTSPLASQQQSLGQTGSAMAAWQGAAPQGGLTPYVNAAGQPLTGPSSNIMGAQPNAGGGTNYLEPFEGPDAGGIPGIPTPGFRGFRTYADLRASLPEGDPGTVFSDNEMRAAYDYQVSAPRALRDVMDRADTVDYFRGGEVQRVDLGQGIQDYDVRRDSYGNIRSYTPSKNLSAEDAMKIGR